MSSSSFRVLLVLMAMVCARGICQVPPPMFLLKARVVMPQEFLKHSKIKVNEVVYRPEYGPEGLFNMVMTPGSYYIKVSHPLFLFHVVLVKVDVDGTMYWRALNGFDPFLTKFNGYLELRGIDKRSLDWLLRRALFDLFFYALFFAIILFAIRWSGVLHWRNQHDAPSKENEEPEDATNSTDAVQQVHFQEINETQLKLKTKCV